MKNKKTNKNKFSAITLRTILVVILVISNGLFLGITYTVQDNLRQTINYRRQSSPVSKETYITNRKNDLINLGDDKLLILSSFYPFLNHQEAITKDLNKLAEISQVKIKNITFLEESPNLSLVGLPGLFGDYHEQTVNLEFSDETTVKSYLDFIKLLENSLPLFRPEAINITVGSTEKIIYAPLKIGVLVDYEEKK